MTKQSTLTYSAPFQRLDQFERKVAEFFGAPYAVAVDSCTNALELSIRATRPDRFTLEIPYWTYVSVPMMAERCHFQWRWVNNKWDKCYPITNRVIDAAALWERDAYKPGTLMCLSFGHKKFINIGKGGIILLDDPNLREWLVCARYDGRAIHSGKMYVDEVEQNAFKSIGYHYYMTPEQAAEGLEIMWDKKGMLATPVSWRNYPSLSTQPIFEKQLFLDDRPILR